MLGQTRIRPWVLFLLCISFQVSLADEGMWLFNDLPKDHLKSKYDFTPTDEWANHVMLSSVRFNSGGSASFVSSDGLVLTNHHVASDTLAKISTSENNYQTDGFLAKSLEQEIKAPDLELNQLVAIKDVTDQVNAVVKDGMSPTDAFKARRAVRSDIEKQSMDKTGLRSDVVTLFGGAKYHLYQYRKFTDVRVVWAPESAIAYFGGDADNFEYPRYCLDVCLFRVYENGEPAKIDHFLKWSKDGADEGELVFVSGNPGRTQRIFTLDALKYLRDHRLPYVLNQLRRREVNLQQYSYGGPEQARRAKDVLLGVQNGRKAYTGMLQGLQNPAFLAEKSKKEQAILDKTDASLASAWKEIAQAQKRKSNLLGKSAELRGRTFRIAKSIVQLVAEDQKPNSDRLRAYRDSNRESFLRRLYSPAPIYLDLELMQLSDALAQLVESRGGGDPLVQKVLSGKGPRDRAAELLTGTKLIDVEARKALVNGGVAVVESSDDTMIQLARLLDDEIRRMDSEQDEIEEIETQAYAKITKATVAAEGTSTYPDATFTLRLSFGTVKGYIEDGKQIPSNTTLAGAFDHEVAHGKMEPWVMPEVWHDKKGSIDGEVPFNFVCTADIIGGNSGSPVINRKGEFVGIIFDGNIQSLTSDYFYSDTIGRAVSVHSGAILEALRSVYGAERLAQQLGR